MVVKAHAGSRESRLTLPVWPWLAVLAIISFFGGATTDWPLLEHIGYALGGLNLVGLTLTRAGSRGLHASNSVGCTRLTAGDELVETYRIEKRGWWPATWIEIRDRDDPPGSEHHISLFGRSTARTIERHRTFPERGEYWAAMADIRVRDPLGLFTLRPRNRPGLTLDPIPITVYPRPLETPAAIQAARSLTAGRHRWGSEGADATLGDLREYVRGDPPSRIHWRTSARRGTLMVSDPEAQRQRSIWLLVDLGGESGAAERAAGIAAFLAERLQQCSQGVGAVIAGSTVVTVPARRTTARGRHRASSGHILSALARVETADDSALQELLGAARCCTDAGTIVLVSPTVGVGAAAQAGLQRTLRAASHDANVVLLGTST